MLKPDFGAVRRRIEWNDSRVAWVRFLAEEKKMTAREIALDIGLAAKQAPRIFELCKRCDIQLSGQGGRPRQEPVDARAYRVGVQSQNIGLLTRIASRHGLEAGRVAELVLNAALETGEPLCENLLDLDTE